MSRSVSKFARLFSGIAVIGCLATLWPRPAAAQPLGAATRVLTDPPGLAFQVDGQIYTQSLSAMWPSGSKHTLFVVPVQVSNGVQYSFQSWESTGGALSTNPVTITADASVAEYRAVFAVNYLLSLRFSACAAAGTCGSPGTVTVGGVSYTGDADVYCTSGSAVILQAFPNPGWVFMGWQAATGEVIQGFQSTVTLTGPMTVIPIFRVARAVQIETSPPDLKVLADRTPVLTPISLDWGYNTDHSVGVISPQQDRFGDWWAFASWSDGGAVNHAIAVGPSSGTIFLTATFVPAQHVAFLTSPPGLKLKIDGRDNWLAYTYYWGAGETHRIEAPDQQTDAQGRVWAFGGWSSGGNPAQDFVVPASATGNVTVTATYGPMARLTVGSTLPALPVVVDGADCTTPCEVRRAVGTAVRVGAPATMPLDDPSSRADLAGWTASRGEASGSQWSGTLTADPLSIDAVYRTMNRLTAVADPPGSLAWRVSPESPDAFYDTQTTVTLTALPNPGFKFRAWTGDASGASPSATLAMNAPHAVRALADRVPYIDAWGVVNAAGSTPGSGVAAGSVVSVFGANLANSTELGPASPLVQALGGATVQVAGRWMPLMFVSPSQINLQLPEDLPTGVQTLIVSVQGLGDVETDFTVLRAAPGLFQQIVDGRSFALALHEDGSLVTVDSPARGGELVSLWGTGFGPANYPRPMGFAVPKDPAVLLADPATILLDEAALTPERAFAAPGYVGIDILQFRVPDGLASGAALPLHVRIDGSDSNLVLLPVK